MKIVVFVLVLSAQCELTAALYRQHFFINEAKSWRDAQRYCRENYGDLSTVDSQRYHWHLYNAINIMNANLGSDSNTGNPYYYKDSWVGLNRISTNSWQWSDGTEVNSNIGVYYYDSDYTGSCAFALYYWLYHTDCEQQHTFFCYKWVPELILVRENKNWEEALQYCRTHHTDLASLPTNVHLLQVNQTTAINETTSMWTGLRFLAGSWFWLSGEALGNLGQLPACPANYLYCGSRNLEAQSWENRDCMEKRNFVCY